MFNMDPSKFRIVDLSSRVDPPGTNDRPFRAEQALLADECYKNTITTHTHVGAHIESPNHFNLAWKRLEDYPMEKFCGRAVVFEFAGVACEQITGAILEADLGRLIRPQDIVLCRNTHPAWKRVQVENRKLLPYLNADGARWLVAKQVKLLVIDDFCGIRLAHGAAISRENHAILLAPGADVLILEGADHVDQLTKKVVFFMSFPISFGKVDSMWTRAVAFEER